MNRLVLAVAALAVAASSGTAQSVSPLIAEYDRPTTGRFEIQNPSLYPVTVVVDARGFTLDPHGAPTFGSLPPHVDVRLSETSFQVAPQGSHTVFYEVAADSLPAWFTIYSTLTGPRPQAGVQLRLQLPHTVYVYGDPLRREDLVVEEVAWDRDAREVVVRLANTSSRLGRVARARVRGGGGEAEHPGFPLLPGRQRSIRLAWEFDEGPDELTLEVGEFEVRQAVPIARSPIAPTG